MINTRQEAENLVQYAKYPPRGTRSNGPIRSGMYGSAGTYQKTANDEIVLLPMMETKTAVENMESILDVEGINGVYIGPSDLGFSYGLVPKLDRDEPEILKIYEKIVKECGKRGLYPGIHCSGAEAALAALLHDLLVDLEDLRFVTVEFRHQAIGKAEIGRADIDAVDALDIEDRFHVLDRGLGLHHRKQHDLVVGRLLIG